MPPPMVLATATLFCRPLRFLCVVLFVSLHAVPCLTSFPLAGLFSFDVEQSVAVLRHDGGEKDEAVLGHVHVHLSISVPPDDEPTHCTEEISSQQHDELSDVLGCFVSVRVRLQLPPESDSMRRWRVQYQLSPATESFLLPADHTNVFRVLVTEALVTWVATTALVFSFLPPKQRHEEEKEEGDGDEKPSLVEKTPPPVTISTPYVSTEEAEATRRLTEAAATAAHEAAEAAHEAARAATHAMEEAKTLHEEHGQLQQQQQQKYERERARELEAERQRAHARLDADAKENAREAEHALAKQQLQHELERLSDEKQQLRDGAERLTRELQDKEAAMEQWTQQTATTAAAIELLKQRVDADARERDELQRRLRVLEAEKLELQQKSRACVVQ